MNNPVLVLLQKIRQRLGMYLDSPSIIKLRAFLNGYYLCKFEMNQNTKEDDNFWNLFGSWIAKKYKIETSHSWAHIILFFSPDDHDAFENFYKLLDEFLVSQD